MIRPLMLTCALPFLLLCAACSWDQQKPETQLVPQTKLVTVLPPKLTPCPKLGHDFEVTGDLVNAVPDRDQKYGACAAKVDQWITWRSQHGGN